MIRLPCFCGQFLELSDDKAGGQVQCPHCGRLRDVPSIDELRNLTEDGTYRLDAPVKKDPTRFSQLKRTYARKRFDESGHEIDLRGPADESSEPESPPTAPEPLDDILPVKEAIETPPPPKYDPETGQRITPMDLQDVADQPQRVPTAKITEPPPERTELLRPVAEILAPGSLVAMFFVLLTHVLGNLLLFALVLTGVITGNSPVALTLPLIGAGLLAHYANVIAEIGPEQRDELPRFLRSFHIIEDVIAPFANFMLAVAYCFAPAIIAVHALHFATRWQAGVVGTLVGLGAIIFPAALLTTVTSGSIANLRPDRLAGTIKVLGTRYAFYMVLFITTAAIYAVGIWATIMQAENQASQTHPTNKIFQFGPAYALLAVGVFAVHYFLWHLGLAYRRDNSKFPWVWQLHAHASTLPPPPPRRPTGKTPLPQNRPPTGAGIRPKTDLPATRRRQTDPTPRPLTRNPNPP